MSKSSLSDLSSALGDLMQAERKLGATLLDALGAMFKPAATEDCGCSDALCCDVIPTPGWVPHLVATPTSVTTPGGTAELSIRVTNGGPGPRTIGVEATGGAVVSPALFALVPFQRETVTVTLAVSPKATLCSEQEIIVTVSGCEVQVIRWTVKVERCAPCEVPRVDVCDTQDLGRHWYDYFYCPHPCATERRKSDGSEAISYRVAPEGG